MHACMHQGSHSSMDLCFSSAAPLTLCTVALMHRLPPGAGAARHSALQGVRAGAAAGPQPPEEPGHQDPRQGWWPGLSDLRCVPTPMQGKGSACGHAHIVMGTMGCGRLHAGMCAQLNVFCLFAVCSHPSGPVQGHYCLLPEMWVGAMHVCMDGCSQHVRQNH